MEENKNNWIFELRPKVEGIEEQPKLLKGFLEANWKIHVNIGTALFNPIKCEECRQSAKVYLKWRMLIDDNVESEEVYCYKCGDKTIKEISENSSKLGRVQIITTNWQEQAKEIRENLTELKIKYDTEK